MHTRNTEEVPAEHGVSLLRSGDCWIARFGGRVNYLHDAKGLSDLAKLLARPGEELHVLHLIEEELRVVSPHLRAASIQDGLNLTTSGSRDQPLDARAREAYRRRYVELVADIEDAENCHDLGRMQRLNAELAQLVAQLKQRSHTACAATERARKAVYNRLRAAIRRVGKCDRELGLHLSVTIKTGVCCSYRPEHARYVRAC
jgi:hypothetical protein